ncbi:hypothetical protein AYK24_08955 [Thermoplasmatales archaeon SG8-52-4]|nr:MAG: hypothetical protein AYK24_08955 [Thermoplasmatales archaeon SG8-52-4]
MKDTDVIIGEIKQADETGIIIFESSKELLDFSIKFYNALLEIPQYKLDEKDKKAIEWLKIGLADAEKQIKEKGGMQVMMSKKLIYTIKAVSGIFSQHKTFKNHQILDELYKHIRIH